MPMETTTNTIHANELHDAAQAMTLAQADEWTTNHVNTINSVITGKGWDHTPAAVATIDQAIINESLNRGDQGRRVATMVLAARIVQAQARGVAAWD